MSGHHDASACVIATLGIIDTRVESADEMSSYSKQRAYIVRP